MGSARRFRKALNYSGANKGGKYAVYRSSEKTVFKVSGKWAVRTDSAKPLIIVVLKGAKCQSPKNTMFTVFGKWDVSVDAQKPISKRCQISITKNHYFPNTENL